MTEHIQEVITSPDLILKDKNHLDTALIIKHIQDTNLNVVLKLALAEKDDGLKNSIMTFYRIRDKNVNKLLKKQKTVYKKE